MHELSIVTGIIDIAEKEACKAGGGAIEEIEIDIGILSTVQMEAFEFAWHHGVKDTLLEHADLRVNRIEGEADCMECGLRFPIEEAYDPCPSCESRSIRIHRGRELRVRSLIMGSLAP